MRDMEQLITEFEHYLRQEERSRNTIAKYKRDVRAFFFYLGHREVTKERTMEWKEILLAKHAPASVNSMLAALNSFLEWVQLPLCKVRALRIQKSIFTRPERELNRDEYLRLIAAAEKSQNIRLSLLIQTICATGIRISELRHISVSAIAAGRVTVACKGKTRTVFLPADLCRKLRGYCRTSGIRTGSVFCTKFGKSLDRSNIWRDMKALCSSAGVSPEKVFPHNLRHLFARTYYRLEKDLSRLADLLGHSSVSTTRIYTMESGAEHARQLERMGLVPPELITT